MRVVAIAARQPRQGLRACRAVRDDLAEQRIVERRHARARRCAYRRGCPRLRASALALTSPRAGREVLRGILRIDAAFDGAARATALAAAPAAGPSPPAMAICSATRSRPRTASVTGCSTWMRAFISRKKNSPPRHVDQKLHRAGAAVGQVAPRSAPRPRAERAQLAPDNAGRGRLLDQLLVAALHRAVALTQMDDVARAVAQHLHFDVPRPARRSVPGTRAHRRRPRQPRPRPARAPRRRSSRRSTRFMPRPPPPPTALTSSGAPMRCRSTPSSRDCTSPAGHHRHVRRLGLRARAQFVARRFDLRRGRADEYHALLLAQPRERGALRQKP